MNAALWWLGQNTVTVLVLIPLVLIASRFLRSRPAVQHLLWLIVLMKFVTPPIVNWPISLADIRDRIWVAPGPVKNTVEVERSEIDAALLFSALQDQALVGPATETAEAHWGAGFVGPALWTVTGIWLCGAVTCAGFQVRRIAQHARFVRQGRAAPAQLVAGVRDVAQQLGLRPPKSLVSWGIASPFVWCVGCVRLIWPQALTSHEDVAKSRGVIAHELAHVRRGDHWVAWLELSAGILWWWNPLYWLVRRRLRESAEMACDALAISTCPERRREYAELLLEHSAGFKTGMPAHVLAVSAGTPSSFERRLSMILSERVSGKVSWWGILAAVGLAAVALPGWSAAQQEASEGQTEVAQKEPSGSTNDRISQYEKAYRAYLKLQAAGVNSDEGVIGSSDDEGDGKSVVKQKLKNRGASQKADDARQTIIKLIEAGQLNEAIAQLEALRARQSSAKVKGDARKQAEAKERLDKAGEQLRAETERINALLKAVEAENTVAQKLASLAELDAEKQQLARANQLKELDARVQELRELLEAAELELQSKTERKTLERTAAQELLEAIRRNEIEVHSRDPRQIDKPAEKKPLNATFPEKWKDLIKELPEHCTKKLPQDSPLSWKYCMSCHTGLESSEAQKRFLNDGLLLPSEPAPKEPAKARKGESTSGLIDQFEGKDRLYFLFRVGDLVATDPKSGQVLWKNHLADALPDQSVGRWSWQESVEGKGLLLNWIKDDKTHYKFVLDMATGTMIHQGLPTPSTEVSVDNPYPDQQKAVRWLSILDGRRSKPKDAGESITELTESDRNYRLLRSGDLTATNSDTGKLYWKTHIAESLPEQAGESWTMYHSTDGKLIILTRTRKDDPIQYQHIFDAATGKMMKAVRIIDKDAADKPTEVKSDLNKADSEKVARWLESVGELKQRTEEQYKVQHKLGVLAGELVAAGKADAEIVEALYQVALDRKPSEAESAFCEKYLSMSKDRKVAIDNIVFQLTFAKETTQMKQDATPQKK